MKAKQKLREFWIIESEYGLDIKRYYTSICRSEEEAKAKKKWLDVKDPYDKHNVFHAREVKLKK